MTYKLHNDKDGNLACIFLYEKKDGPTLAIPTDPDNTDYQEYLEWVSAGNTPEESD